MKRFLKTASVLIMIFLISSLCGCSFSSSGEELMKAPLLPGEFGKVEEALKSGIDGDFTLKYPSTGEYRSAVFFYDTDFDGNKEAFAFYSTTENGTSVLHLALITVSDGKWTLSAKQDCSATGIETVTFSDLTGNDKSEIIVGWSVYGSVDKTVTAYEVSGNTLTPVLSEPYTSFLVCDIDDDLQDDILIYRLNSSEVTASVKYFSVTKDGVAEKGSCISDGNVSALTSMKLSRIKDGTKAVVLDEAKGGGLITEIIYFSENSLINPLYKPTSTDKPLTFRTLDILSFDVDGDGFAEIPVLTDSQVSGGEKTVSWCLYDGTNLIKSACSITDTSNGFSVILPKSLPDTSVAVYDENEKEYIIYEYYAESDNIGKELLKIKSSKEKDASFDGYENILSIDGYTYFVKSSEIDFDTLKEEFFVYNTKK